MTVELSVGYVGRRRDGGKSVIVWENEIGGLFHFKDDMGRWYTERGRYTLSCEHPFDIIGPWEKPQASPIQPVSLRPGVYGIIFVANSGMVRMEPTRSQAELTAAIETLKQIRDAEVLK